MKLTALVAATLFCLPASMLHAGKTPPTPTPILSAPTAVQVAPRSLPAGTVAAIQTQIASYLSTRPSLTVGQTAQLRSVLSQLRSDTALLSQLNLTRAQIDALLAELER
jgi:hypothetical protein